MKEPCLRGEGNGWGAYSCYIYISIDTGQRVMFVDKLLETCVKLARIKSGWSMLVGRQVLMALITFNAMMIGSMDEFDFCLLGGDRMWI